MLRIKSALTALALVACGGPVQSTTPEGGHDARSLAVSDDRDFAHRYADGGDGGMGADPTPDLSAGDAAATDAGPGGGYQPPAPIAYPEAGTLDDAGSVDPYDVPDIQTPDGPVPGFYTPHIPTINVDDNGPIPVGMVDYPKVCDDAVECCQAQGGQNLACQAFLGENGCAATIDAYDCQHTCLRLYSCCNVHPNHRSCGEILIALDNPELWIESERTCSADLAMLEGVCP